jgi:peptidoglycan hydrolase FlgJ
LKSMREATPQEGVFDNSNTQLYTSMLDSQLAQSLSRGKGIGLADMMLRQMERQGMIPAETTADKVVTVPRFERQSFVTPERSSPLAPTANPVSVSQVPDRHVLPEFKVLPDASRNAATTHDGFAGAADFVAALLPHASDASKTLGVPAQFLLGQAALESAWGKRTIRDVKGNNSFNLFGIKAGKGWHGAVAQAVTTEYVNGVARKKTESFRAYGSYAESFQDYAKLLKNSPRYAPLFIKPLDADGFARGLQQAGYATDPSYAVKLARVINSGVLRRTFS